jgi:uncharacterized protein (DUF488 family)
LTEAIVSTIGFTKTTAEHFFERLAKGAVKRLVDVRLNNASQLAGFAKAKDLAYFLKKIGGIEYVHEPLLAPTDLMLKAHRNGDADWVVYESRFLGLMADRQIEKRFRPEMFDGSCLLCSESVPHQCHRRLVCEYLNEKWGGKLVVCHL